MEKNVGALSTFQQSRHMGGRARAHTRSCARARARSLASLLSTCVRVYSNVINLNSKLAVNIYEPTSHKR